jgi:hypothetical protein
MVGVIDLSATEKAQLGHAKQLLGGKTSEFMHPTPGMWKRLRTYLVERSAKSNPSLDLELTAYTPGETWGLLQHPKIKAWHVAMRLWRVPSRYRTIAFVPCAKTKPWEGPAVAKSVLYSAYNQLRGEQDQVYFVTVSEPLGVVPQHLWGDFPQYDNPGLFHDDALRSGMLSEQWKLSPAQEKMIVPFDEKAYLMCIGLLGQEIGMWMKAHEGRSFISFVDNGSGSPSTHQQMLRVAEAASGIKIDHHLKKPVARKTPYGYIRGVLEARGVRFSKAAVEVARMERATSRERGSQHQREVVEVGA